MNFTIPQIRGHWPELWEVRVSASLFEHKPGYIEPNRDQNLTYPCDKCEKIFPYKSDLKKHEMAQHYGTKCKCSQCGLQYSREDNLQHHIRRVHDGDYDDKFKCEKCNEAFSKKSSLDRHVKVSKN